MTAKHQNFSGLGIEFQLLKNEKAEVKEVTLAFNWKRIAQFEIVFPKFQQIEILILQINYYKGLFRICHCCQVTLYNGGILLIQRRSRKLSA